MSRYRYPVVGLERETTEEKVLSAIKTCRARGRYPVTVDDLVPHTFFTFDEKTVNEQLRDLIQSEQVKQYKNTYIISPHIHSNVL
jgi:hypothetical protein